RISSTLAAQGRLLPRGTGASSSCWNHENPALRSWVRSRSGSAHSLKRPDSRSTTRPARRRWRARPTWSRRRGASIRRSSASGTGVAASDEPEARGRQIDLALYPEIREVIITRAALIIDDAQGHPLLDPVRGRIEEQGISAIAVIPMACDGEMIGVVFIRSRTRAGFAPRE